MTVQKLLTYTPLDITGQKLSSTHQLNLNVLENSGNYLIQKDIIRHYASQRQGTVSRKCTSTHTKTVKYPYMYQLRM